MPLKQIEDEDYQSLLTGLVRGEYHLLLGAGASIGALGGDGRPLPSGETLAKELVTDFVINTDGEKIDLREAYEIIEKKINAKGQNRSEYFRYRFSGCIPTWQEVLKSIIWRKIWTLNIDDILEQAYNISSTPVKQKPKIINWNSLYSDPDYQKNEVQIIHLHGYAAELDDKNSSIVFSIIEYLQAIAGRHSWHRIFGDEFSQKPFVIVGARLSDEYDLAEILRRGNQSKNLTGRPSLIVLRDIPDYKKEQFRRWGLLPIVSDAHSFFNKLTDDSLEVESKLAKTLPKPQLTSIPKEAQIFLQQYLRLNLEAPATVHRGHDFYQGDDPLWADILSNLDARFEIVDKLLAAIKEGREKSTEKPYQHIYCISGPPGSGKSTSLLRISRELITRGYDVFLFRGEQRLDLLSTIWWLENSTKCVILVDGTADFAADLGRLAIRCSKAKINLLIITAERENRLQQVYKNIDPRYLLEGNDYRLYLLGDIDIERLLSKLRDARRLGILTRRSLHEKVRYFRKESNRQLLVAMSKLEGGKGFKFRIRNEFSSDIRTQELRLLYALSCITYHLGYPLPFGIACATLGIHPDKLTQVVNNELSGLLHIDSKGLKPRHRVIASIVVTTIVESHDLYNLTRDLAKALSPYVTLDTIRQRTLHYRITRLLLNADTICNLVKPRRAREWYIELEKDYGWNARFWEQRAITEVKNYNFPRARSYAEEALRIQKHPFTLNTLGSILTRMAFDYYDPGTEEASDIFWEGIQYLKESRGTGEEGIQPYTAFFTRSITYMRKLKEKGLDDQRLHIEWQHWINHIKSASVFQYQENYEMVQEYHLRWVALLATPPNQK